LHRSIILGAHVLGSKTQSRKGIISYKTINGTSTMKKHCEVEHLDIFKMYISEIIQHWHFVETNVSNKQSSKVQKVITPISISTFFNNTTTYKNQVNNKRLSLMILCWLL
jgi:hypothetical protein